MKTTEHEGLHCPSCKNILPCTTNLTGDLGPAHGDFTVCIRCNNLLRFAADPAAPTVLTLETAIITEVPHPYTRAKIARLRQLNAARIASLN